MRWIAAEEPLSKQGNQGNQNVIKFAIRESLVSHKRGLRLAQLTTENYF